MLVSLDRLAPLQIGQTRQSSTYQDSTDSRRRYTDLACDLTLQQALLAQLNDQQSRVRRNRAGRTSWSRRCVGQCSRTACQVASQPFAYSRRRHAAVGCRLRHTQTEFGDLVNHLKSAGKGESGILMGVHPAGFPEGWMFGDFQSPGLSPDEPSIQPIEASQLERRLGVSFARVRHSRVFRFLRHR